MIIQDSFSVVIFFTISEVAMESGTYESIVSFIQGKDWDVDRILVSLTAQFPAVSPNSLRSILGAEYQRHIKGPVIPCQVVYWSQVINTSRTVHMIL